jgi:hypothetical protein
MCGYKYKQGITLYTYNILLLEETMNDISAANKNNLFDTGATVITQNLHSAIVTHHLHKHQGKKLHDWVSSCLLRHCRGDWGDLKEEDKAMNEEALISGARIFSAYAIPQGFKLTEEKLWIITEADRSVTTLLFPSDY